MSTDTRDLIARLEHTPSLPSAWPFPDAPVVVPARLRREHLDDVVEAARLLREDGEREVWRHFKGNLYEVLMRGRYEHSGETCVIYRRADGSDPSVWVRPQTFGTGAWEDWVEVDGAEVPRFERVASDSQSGPQGGPLSAGKRGPHPGVAEVEQVQRFSEMRADNLLTEDDPFTLIGFALLEAKRGKREMPAYLFELAARICLARGDTATAARVREMEVQHLAEPPALAHPDAGSEARERVAKMFEEYTKRVAGLFGRAVDNAILLLRIMPEERQDRGAMLKAAVEVEVEELNALEAHILAALRGEEVGG